METTTKDELLGLLMERGKLRLYAVEFAKGRYGVYYVNDKGELEVLWPSDSYNGAKATDKPREMRYSKNKNHPAWHYWGNYGYYMTTVILDDVCEWLRVSKDVVRVDVLRGAIPSGH